MENRLQPGCVDSADGAALDGAGSENPRQLPARGGLSLLVAGAGREGFRGASLAAGELRGPDCPGEEGEEADGREVGAGERVSVEPNRLQPGLELVAPSLAAGAGCDGACGRTRVGAGEDVSCPCEPLTRGVAFEPGAALPPNRVQPERGAGAFSAGAFPTDPARPLFAPTAAPGLFCAPRLEVVPNLFGEELAPAWAVVAGLPLCAGFSF